VARAPALLHGRYRLQARIAHTGQTVAVKQLLARGAASRAAFEREADLLSQLSHPCLPVVSDYFADRDGAFVVMTFVPGPDLAQQLARRARPFPLATVLGWASDVLDALSYLHTRHPPVVHRDVKPRNLKRDSRGRVILLDFGLAKESTGGGDSSLAGFTLPYAPLEQVRRQGVEARSDLYALGATLYELLARRAPADAVRRAAALAEGHPDPLVALHELNPSVTHSVSGVIAQTLAPRPTQRPATARALLAALTDAADGPATVLAEVTTPPTESIGQPTGTVTFLATGADQPRLDSGRACSPRHCATPGRRSPWRLRVSVRSDWHRRRLRDGRSGTGRRRRCPTRAAHDGRAYGAAQRATELINGEYVSHVLPRLSRLLGAAHGGQIVLGRATRELSPGAVGLRDLGSHRLPDVAEPEHVYQVAVPDLRADFPALVSHEVRAARVPYAAPPLFGRDRDVAALVGCLRGPAVRLLTH
jgi:serine/threonine protein kinase